MSNKRSAPDAGPSKRTRFASPSRLDTSAEDFLEDDVSQVKKAKDRRALKGKEGYESDSSDDGEGVVNSRKAGAPEDEDEDMFGDAPEKPADGPSKGKEKEKFMDLGDVEGQEFGGKGTAGESDSDYDSEEEARRTDQAKGLDSSMGFELTAFNVKAELTEGRMTADGEAFVANDKDPHEQYDKWLDGMDRQEVKKARRAKREQDKLEAEREQKEADEEASGTRKEKEGKIMHDVVALLERGETVLEGMQRTGRDIEKERKKAEKAEGGKKKSWAEKQKERKALLQGGSGSAVANGMNVDPSTTEETPFSRLSNLVSTLTTLGHLDVYSMSRESLQRMLPPPPNAPSRPAPGLAPGSSAGSNESAGMQAPSPPMDMRAFEYRFSKGYIGTLPVEQRPIEREVFGPFPLITLIQWRATGFFGGPTCENVELRVKSPSPSAGEMGSWGSWAEIVERGMPGRS